MLKFQWPIATGFSFRRKTHFSNFISSSDIFLPSLWSNYNWWENNLIAAWVALTICLRKCGWKIKSKNSPDFIPPPPILKCKYCGVQHNIKENEFDLLILGGVTIREINVLFWGCCVIVGENRGKGPGAKKKRKVMGVFTLKNWTLKAEI